MLFHVLGTVECVSDQGVQIMIAGQRKRALLATLLLARNEWVSVDQLVDAVWNDDAPKSAYGSLKTYVWQLRTAFSGGREAGDALGTGPACYRP